MGVLRFLPRFQKAYGAIAQINAFREHDEGFVERHQLEQLNRIWKSASSNVNHFRELKSQLDLPTEFESIEHYTSHVPVLEKQSVRDRRSEFLSEDGFRGRWLKTGGSTGVPTKVFWSQKAHLRNLHLRYAWMFRYGVDIFDRQAFVWGQAGMLSQSWQDRFLHACQPIEDRLRNRDRFNAHEISHPELDRYLQQMLKSNTRVIYGYSSVVMLLAKRALHTGVTLPSLKLCIMTGELAMPDYEQIVSDAFGAPCKIEYGSVECGILALQNQKGGLEVQDISRFVETVPRDDGFFDIVVTVLDNPAFPLLRYRIGDTTSTAVIRGSNGTTMLKDVLGRSNDFLVTREGGHVHANAVKHAMEQVVKIKRFRAIQNAQGNLEVLVEHDSALESQVRKKMENRLEAILQGYSATVNQVPLIPGNVAGKHLWLTSELYAEECKRN